MFIHITYKIYKFVGDVEWHATCERRSRGRNETEGVESITETSAERESRRDEMQRGSAGRDESRTPSQKKDAK